VQLFVFFVVGQGDVFASASRADLPTALVSVPDFHNFDIRQKGMLVVAAYGRKVDEKF